MRRKDSIALAVGLLVACKPSEPTVSTTTLQPAPAAVTRLESPTPIQTTKLESGSSAPTNTTTISVQQAITDLQAQKTSEGLRINLPENILFDFDKSDLRPTAKPTLQKLSVLLKNDSAPTEIQGHTDSRGGDDYNQTLSERRANAVKDYLASNFQISSDRLTSKGFGKTQPIAPNTKPDGSDNPEGRQKNRRVEVIIRTPS
jgi:outer membrane protein OmpA-like peptidoglycan-associated protein